MVNKVYSIVLGGAVVPGPFPGGIITQQVNILSPNREIKLKSIYYDLSLFEALTGIPLNLCTQVSQRCQLFIGVGGVPLISNIFDPDLGFPPIIIQNADSIYLHTVGKVEFDSLIVNNVIPIRYVGINYDALLAIEHRVTIVAETEENL